MEKKDITISSLFIELRNKLNLTQTQLAKELNVSRSTIAKIENKEIDISDKLLFMFLSKYKMNIHNNYNIIFDYKKPEKKPNKILQMIKELTEYHLNLSLNAISINKLKFLTPINPNEHINLQVEINYTFSESEVYINTASIFSGQITFFKLNKAVYKY